MFCLLITVDSTGIIAGMHVVEDIYVFIHRVIMEKVVARLVGFEPTTHGFEDRYSDPLSYRRTISRLHLLTLP